MTIWVVIDFFDGRLSYRLRKEGIGFAGSRVHENRWQARIKHFSDREQILLETERDFLAKTLSSQRNAISIVFLNQEIKVFLASVRSLPPNVFIGGGFVRETRGVAACPG
jgi:hypothetical protein